VADALSALGRSPLALALLILAGPHGVCAAGLVDPTQPPAGYSATAAGGDARSAQIAAAPEPIRLQMVARDGSSRLAVVNGRRVRAGDRITLDGKAVKVVAIGDDSIVLDQDGNRQTLELIPRSGVSPRCAAQSSHRPTCRDNLLGASP
jgi:hypothetical protein